MSGKPRHAMHILAFDAVVGPSSAALAGDEGKLRVVYDDGPAGNQAERLVPMIERLLAQAGSSYDQVDVFAVTVGPGSFTSCRTAVAAARAFALAAGRPVMAATGLEVAAEAALAARGGARPVVAMHDARRSEVMVQAFSAEGVAAGEPILIPIEDVAERVAPDAVLAGNGAGLAASLCGGTHRFVADRPGDAGDLVARIRRRLAWGERPIAGEALRPLYVRPPDAKPVAHPAGALRSAL
ncbi:tRNA (adenosine(37)-N6)-threonylcarbamoyltransferase complex dimerization subunit type 1 TsaB [Marinivivus vitaminiproducens]|uniref:tRNA (adenosine(37)-N6)-threonylcarbamoyltransferase complex dimerization subunit type 1 TsaB n=1 Tax=Marinivivus vitaminiproducens TaxID=3035935 RepID=UPI002798DD3D|nr:tRNA (adenosine(37)-N6)-threonylcarbamoyltransferase complex dimerization subunit type 1 TsaB [Geminicoccaceae bacterium SCSIO 64248]